jgi:hypothetical protein
VADYLLYVRDATRARVAQIDDYSRAEIAARFNAVGAWSVDLPAGTEAARQLALDGAGIIIQRDADTILSGPVRLLDRKWSASQDTLTVSGPDDLVYLKDRWASAVPAAAPGVYTAAAYDIRTGLAEVIIRQFVDVNAGPGARTERAVSGLTLAASGGAGTSLTQEARFPNLLEFIQEIALKGGGLGFRIVQVGLGLEFQVYAPVDRTASAIFSATLGNLEEFSYSRQAPTANHILAAGGAELTARVFVERGDTASILKWGRIEQFVDQRQTVDLVELGKAIDQALLEGAEQKTVALKPRDTDGLAFWTHYKLGDLVTVVVDAEPIREVVIEVNLSLTSDRGAVIRPVVGPAAAAVIPVAATDKPLERMSKRHRGHDRRISNLERR